MIAADTSALVAIVLGEPDAELYLTQLRDHSCLLSAVSLTEAAIVVEARHTLFPYTTLFRSRKSVV